MKVKLLILLLIGYIMVKFIVMINLSEPDRSFILTNALFDDEEESHEHYNRIVNVAELRGAGCPERIACAITRLRGFLAL